MKHFKNLVAVAVGVVVAVLLVLVAVLVATLDRSDDGHPLITTVVNDCPPLKAMNSALQSKVAPGLKVEGNIFACQDGWAGGSATVSDPGDASTVTGTMFVLQRQTDDTWSVKAGFDDSDALSRLCPSLPVRVANSKACK